MLRLKFIQVRSRYTRREYIVVKITVQFCNAGLYRNYDRNYTMCVVNFIDVYYMSTSLNITTHNNFDRNFSMQNYEIPLFSVTIFCSNFYYNIFSPFIQRGEPDLSHLLSLFFTAFFLSFHLRFSYHFKQKEFFIHVLSDLFFFTSVIL